MLRHIVFILSAGLVVCGCSNAPQTTKNPQKYDGPRDVIVDGHLAVDAMEIVASPRANELAQRLQQAARANPEWWLEHVNKARPGEPMPYDARLGLSEAEYEEFLATKMSTQKKSEVEFVISKKENDVFVFDGGEALPDFTGIEVDLKNDVVRTLFGVLTERSEIDASDDSALGAWVGTQWKVEESDPNGITGTVVKLAVGKLKQSGRCVIYYDVRKIGQDGKTRISHVLNYDLPPRE